MHSLQAVVRLRCIPDAGIAACRPTFPVALPLTRMPCRLQASFRQWQVERSVPQLEEQLAAATAARDVVVVDQEEEVRGAAEQAGTQRQRQSSANTGYAWCPADTLATATCQSLEPLAACWWPPQVSSFAELLLTRLRLGEALRDMISDPAAALRFLNPGRMVRVDSAPPDPHRQLPPLGTYVEPAAATSEPVGQQNAVADLSNGAVKHRKGGGAAAAAAADGDAEPSSSEGLRGTGSDAVAAVDASSVWGVLVNFQKAGKAKPSSSSATGDGSDDDGGSSKGSSTRYAIDVLVSVDPATLPRGAAEGATGPSSRGVLPRLLPPGAAGGVAIVLTLPLEHLVCLSAVRLRVVKDLRSAEARSSMLSAAAEVIKRHSATGSSAGSSQLPLLDPVQDMKVRLLGCAGMGAAAGGSARCTSTCVSGMCSAASSLLVHCACATHSHTFAAASLLFVRAGVWQGGVPLCEPAGGTGVKAGCSPAVERPPPAAAPGGATAQGGAGRNSTGSKEGTEGGTGAWCLDTALLARLSAACVCPLYMAVSSLVLV